MRYIAVLIITLTLIGCASSPPRNKRNACLLLSEKDEWSLPLRNASRKWGIPQHTILSIIYHESKFVSDAKPPRKKFLGIKIYGTRISSAYGYSQALDGTWEEYKRRTKNWTASRSNFADSVDFIGWYLNRSVRSLGISSRNAYELYLAYHQGIAGYRRGSFRRSPSIRRYAKRVQETALDYKKQIRSCS